MQPDLAKGTSTYALSAYLSPPGRDCVLHSQRHDYAVALWRRQGRQAELVSYWELERFTGLKHHDLPLGSEEATAALIEDLLAEEGLGFSDVTEIWGTPGIATSDAIERRFGTIGVPIHSLAHLYSSMLVDTEIFAQGDIIALAIDGGPDTALDAALPDVFYVGAYSSRGEVVHRSIESPGPLFLAAQARFGLAPGTLMALAEASPVTCDLDPAEVRPHQRYYGGYDVYPRARDVIAEIVPAAEEAAAAWIDAGRAEGLTQDELIASAAMKVVQELAEIIISRAIDMLLAESGLDPTSTYLALSGGVALNCPANSKMMRRYGFAGLLAPPCVNDSGQAFGLGLLGLMASSEEPLAFRLGGAFHGSRRLELGAALEEFRDHVVSTSPFDPETFVDDVVRAPLAWVEGRAEIGPRALGHRSILADPRTLAAKDRLNVMKGRQWWRPVAPIVLANFAEDWFEEASPSPFMLQTFQVRKERRGEVPAITHLDGSARVQTLEATDDARLFEALDCFHLRTGVPILCNTSLNDRGEPIVSTAAEALNFCVRKGVEVAYVNGLRIKLNTHPNDLKAPQIRQRWFLDAGQRYRPLAWQEWFQAGVTAEMVWLLARFPEMRPLAGTSEGRDRLQTAFDSMVQQPSMATNYAEFLAEFGPLSQGSTRHAF